MQASDLVGAWDLVRFQISFSDGRTPAFPMGEDARGRIVYAASGHVSAVLTRGDRPGLGVGGLETAHRADVSAKATAFDGYMSYAGTYRLEGDEIVHHVEMALLPEAVGRDQRRHVAWDGETLTLSYEVTARSGVVRRYALAWRRAEG